MSNYGKHHFHLKEYSILQLLYAGTLPAYKSFRIEYSFRWKCTYRHKCSCFYNEMGSKKKKTCNLKKKTFTQIVAVGRFLIFQKMYNDCKSNVSEHQRCTQLNSISVGKEITGIPSRPTGILQHLEVFYILF